MEEVNACPCLSSWGFPKGAGGGEAELEFGDGDKRWVLKANRGLGVVDEEVKDEPVSLVNLPC